MEKCPFRSLTSFPGDLGHSLVWGQALGALGGPSVLSDCVLPPVVNAHGTLCDGSLSSHVGRWSFPVLARPGPAV